MRRSVLRARSFRTGSQIDTDCSLDLGEFRQNTADIDHAITVRKFTVAYERRR
jgi:hypothetical protein